MNQNLLEIFGSQPKLGTMGLKSRMAHEDSCFWIINSLVRETKLAYKILIKQLGTMHK